MFVNLTGATNDRLKRHYEGLTDPTLDQVDELLHFLTPSEYLTEREIEKLFAEMLSTAKSWGLGESGQVLISNLFLLCDEFEVYLQELGYEVYIYPGFTLGQ